MTLLKCPYVPLIIVIRSAFKTVCAEIEDLAFLYCQVIRKLLSYSSDLEASICSSHFSLLSKITSGSLVLAHCFRGFNP